MKNRLQKKQEGFTIIEVLIVLAIAGLIMVIVLIAVPQLQRNQRNQARQAIAGRVATEVNNYAGNNNGQIPDSAGDITDLTNRYLSNVDRNDPQTGTAMGITRLATAPAAGVPTGGNLPAVGAFNYREGMVCNGEALAVGNGRNFALWTQLEGGAVYCLDNR